MSNDQQFNRLKELAAQLPPQLRSDWDGTNHYDLTANVKAFFWMDLSDAVDHEQDPCNSEYGQRLGLIMDIAAEVGRLKDEGVL